MQFINKYCLNQHNVWQRVVRRLSPNVKSLHSSFAILICNKSKSSMYCISLNKSVIEYVKNTCKWTLRLFIISRCLYYESRLVSNKKVFISKLREKISICCRSVILLRPKMEVAPHKHDVISMPTQQCTITR